MKRLFYILALLLIFINTSLADEVKTVQKDITTTASDGFSLYANLEYPKSKTQKEFNTVILLHSIGYNSEWWETLPQELLNSGYAVLKIDLRGHGKSVFNGKLVRTSWSSMTNKAYAKYPDDVIKIIEYVKSENPKREFFKNYVFVGADIGGSTAVLASDKLQNKPKTIVLLSPVVNSHGLYIPVKFANLDNVDILSICGTDDLMGDKTQKYLKKFAQAEFITYTSEAHATGIMMLKNDKTLSKIITAWIDGFFK